MSYVSQGKYKDTEVIYYRVYEQIKAAGGMRKCEVVKALGIRSRTADGAITRFEEMGLLLCEDQYGVYVIGDKE
jgi:hypothetical protein